MKTQLTTLLLASILFAGCSSRDELDGQVEAYMLKNTHDPDSYEFINLVPYDTIFLLKKYTEVYLQEEELGNSLKRTYELGAGTYAPSHPQRLSEKEGYETFLRSAKKNKAKADSIAKSANPRAYSRVLYTHEFRAKNKLGALEKATYFVSAGPDGKLLKVADSEKGLE